ncbi:17406_t:CDS:2 [Entrophospora sp. SA101]|nr:570_t:CDS:2 [Entrophospora sp. SA101]CAJ0754039.1 17406_t:CDS:2 [Entrophospora sp. SA101]
MTKKDQDSKNLKNDNEKRTKRAKNSRQKTGINSKIEYAVIKEEKEKNLEDTNSKNYVKEIINEISSEDMNLFPKRLANVTKFVGAHVSMAGGVHNAIKNSLSIGANAFAIFLKNQRRWESPPLNTDHISSFQSLCIKHDYPAKYILPHGNYLVNLANPDEEKREKSYQAFLDDLKRCEALGLVLYNFHPGSTVGMCSVDQAIQNISDCINRAHGETIGITCVVENMAGQGNSIGSKFEELGEIISRVKDKSRIGICFDTCHAFAAETMSKFDQHVGFQYLKGMHLNDSTLELGSNRDRHQNIGEGHLGLEAFRLIMNDDRLNEIPLILETPLADDKTFNDWKKEIELLYGLVGKKSLIGPSISSSLSNDNSTTENNISKIRKAKEETI